MRIALISYISVSCVFFLLGLVIGKILKKDILHGKVMLGVMLVPDVFLSGLSASVVTAPVIESTTSREKDKALVLVH